MEDSAKTPKNLRLATPNPAQLTVLCLHSLHGALAIRHVELDLKPEQDLFKLMQNSEEKYAEPHQRLKLATLNHAQSTVYWVLGLNGAFAQ